jgi:predicted ribosomally synthesized peptide with nif11-like leader
MSEEQLKAFITKVQSDASLQEQLKAEGADPIAIAKAAGFTITQQDLLRQASELSDSELESVAGGGVGDQMFIITIFLK